MHGSLRRRRLSVPFHPAGCGHEAGCLYKRRNAPVFCLSLRPCTRSHTSVFCMSLRGAGRLHRDVAIRVPAGAQNEKQYLRRIPNHLRICPNRSQLVKYLCGDADCHVASLLAMTVGRCHRAPCPHFPAPAAPQQVSTHPTRPTALHPLTRRRLLHVIAKHALAHVVTPLPSACHCEPVRTLVRQSVLPAEEPGKLVLLRANP